MLFALIFTLIFTSTSADCYHAAATRECATCHTAYKFHHFHKDDDKMRPIEDSPVTLMQCSHDKVCAHYAYDMDTPCEAGSGPARYYWGKLSLTHSPELHLIRCMGVLRKLQIL